MKYQLGIIFTVILFTGFINIWASMAQNRTVSDSLWKLYKTSESDSSKILVLNELASCFEESDTDSSLYFLQEALRLSDNGSDVNVKIRCRNDLGIFYSNTGNYAKAHDLFSSSRKLAVSIKDSLAIAYLDLYTGELHMYQSAYPQALILLQRAVRAFERLDKVRDEYKVKKGMVMCYNNIGSIQAENRNFSQSLEYFKKALAVQEKVGDQRVIAGCLNNIGNVYYMQSDYLRAIDYYTRSMKIAEGLDDMSVLSEHYNNMGVVLTEVSRYDEAISYYEKSLKIDREAGDQKGVSLVLGNIALLKIYLKKYHEAIVYANESAEIARKIGGLDEEKCAYEYLATAYDSLKDYKKTTDYLKLFKKMNDSIFNIESARQVKEMEAVYQTEKKQKEIEILNMDKQMQQIEISRQEMQKYSFIAGFILMLALSVVVFRSYSQKRKANILLTEQKRQIEEKNEELKQSNEEISAQRDEIESQRDLVTYQKERIEDIHGQLMSSIHYARRIQNAVLPGKEQVDLLLKDYFILMKPRDIVSGDFFWVTRRRNYLLMAVADCTGHGVPGAFISMLGISFLNDIVARDDVTQASHVLNKLREYVLHSMQQRGIAGDTSVSLSSGEVKDGMDIAFVCINLDPEKNEAGEELYRAQFSGANNPLYLVSGDWSLASGKDKDLQGLSSLDLDSKSDAINLGAIAGNQQPETSHQLLIELKGDKMPISIYRKMSDFTNHEFVLRKGDILYLCSDGYCDQFGGPDNRKFLSKNFRKLLSEISALPMAEQKTVLDMRLNEWMHFNGKESEQTDDITVMGIRI